MAAHFTTNDNLSVTMYSVAGDQLGIIARTIRVVAHTGDGVTAAELASVIDGNLPDALRACMSVNATYKGYMLFFLGLSPEDPYISTASNGAGTVAGDMLPRNTCGLITFTTGFAGRANRGRNYIPFPGEGSCDAQGRPSAGYQVLLTSLADVIVDGWAVAGADGTASVLSSVYHRASASATVVTGRKVRPYWGHQDRRADTGRPNTSPI